QAIHYRHDVSLNAMVAISPRACFHLIQSIVLIANVGLTEPVIRQQAASAIQLVVQTARLRDGSRRVSSVAEVIGVGSDGVQLEEIFRLDRSGPENSQAVPGRFIPTGYRPHFLQRLRATGVDIPDSIFQPSE